MKRMLASLVYGLAVTVTSACVIDPMSVGEARGPDGKADAYEDDGADIVPSELELEVGFERDRRFVGDGVEWLTGTVDGAVAVLVHTPIERLYVFRPPVSRWNDAARSCSDLGDAYRLPRESLDDSELSQLRQVGRSPIVLQQVEPQRRWNGARNALVEAQVRAIDVGWADVPPDNYALQTLEGSDYVLSLDIGSSVMSIAREIARWERVIAYAETDPASIEVIPSDAVRVAGIARDNLAKLSVGVAVACVYDTSLTTRESFDH